MSNINILCWWWCRKDIIVVRNSCVINGGENIMMGVSFLLVWFVRYCHMEQLHDEQGIDL